MPYQSLVTHYCKKFHEAALATCPFRIARVRLAAYNRYTHLADLLRISTFLILRPSADATPPRRWSRAP